MSVRATVVWTAAVGVVAASAGAAAGYWFAATSVSEGSSRGSLQSRSSAPDAGMWLAAGDQPVAGASPRADAGGRQDDTVKAVALAADAGALNALLDDAMQSSSPFERERSLELGLERLVELDPQAALARAQSLDPLTAQRLVPAVLASWAAQDLDAAVAAAFVQPAANTRTAAAREILRRRSDLPPGERRRIAQQLGEVESTEWLLLDSMLNPTPAAALPALEEAAAMAGQNRRHERFDRIARLVALQSPVAALALAENLTDPRDRAALQRTAAGIWAESDPLAAAQWLEAESGGLRWPVVSAVAAPFARSDPQAALLWARRFDSDGARGAWNAVIATIAETDPITAVESALAADVGRGPRTATAIAMAFLARKDPALATTYLDRVTAGSERSQATAQIAIEMARQGEPALALDWLARRQDQAAMRQGRSDIAFAWAANDPEAAFAFGDRMTGRERREWHSAVVNALVNLDPERVVPMVRARRGDPDYPHLVLTTARTIAVRHPDVAVALAGDLPDAGQRDDVFANAIPQLAQRAPNEAVDLLERITDASRRALAAQTVAQIWAQHDVDHALDWVRSMPSGAQRDQSYAALVPSLESPREMESAIERIQQSDVRQRAVFTAAMTLAQQGRGDDARALVRRHPLEPAAMQAFESNLREASGNFR